VASVRPWSSLPSRSWTTASVSRGGGAAGASAPSSPAVGSFAHRGQRAALHSQCRQRFGRRQLRRCVRPLVVTKQAALGEPLHHAYVDAPKHRFELATRRRRSWLEPQGVAVLDVDAVQTQDMKVDVDVERGTKSLQCSFIFRPSLRRNVAAATSVSKSTPAAPIRFSRWRKRPLPFDVRSSGVFSLSRYGVIGDSSPTLVLPR
jgi:hypothetical protein